MNQSQGIAYDSVKKLWRLNRIFCSSDYEASLKFLKEILPFQIHEYRSAEPYKGWVIPPKWDLVKGVIRREDQMIFTVDHPLKIIGLSCPFKGMVSLDVLKTHLHYDHRDPQRIPYHFRQHYRPWSRDWGFCVTKLFYDTLKEGIYEVDIVTEESEGYLKVAEYVKKGKSPISFAFVAHLDHPGMANDDLSGCAVGVELFKKLSQLETKFTYRLLLVQEIIGSVFYLDKTLGKHSQVIDSCFLEMLGSKTPLALQSSRRGNSFIETMLECVLEKQGLSYRKGTFRSIVCNDENVWESHGIPMCSLTRYPYPEYHSDHDNLSIISAEALQTSVELLFETIMQIDKMTLMTKNFEGVFSLAHPDFNLYVDPGQPAFGNLASESTAHLRLLMDDMSLLEKFSSVDALAAERQLPLELVLNYLRLWEVKGLVSLI